MSRPDAILFTIAFYSYLVGFLLFILYTALRREQLGRIATALMAVGLIPHTAAFAVRWSVQHHYPLANMYEYMGLMSWMVVVALLYFTFRYKNRRLGVFVSPVAVMLLVVASLLPADVNRQLMPALQSVWLMIHVTLAALGSGAFLVAFAASALYLIVADAGDKGKKNATTFPWGDFLAYWVGIPAAVALIATVSGLLPSGAAITEFSIGAGASALHLGRVAIGLGIGLVIAAAAWPLVRRQQRVQGKAGAPLGARLFIVMVLGVMVSALLCGFAVKYHWVTLTERSYLKIFEFFGVMLAVSWVTIPLIYGLFPKSGGGLLGRLEVSSAVLEELSYSAVAIGYPLYTVGALFAGAIWAEQAWGTWWGWDPKEVGALIIWLFYTGFLHARYQRNWRGVPAAVLVVLGMVMVFLSFFGNYFFGGMHSFEAT